MYCRQLVAVVIVVVITAAFYFLEEHITEILILPTLKLSTRPTTSKFRTVKVYSTICTMRCCYLVAIFFGKRCHKTKLKHKILNSHYVNIPFSYSITNEHSVDEWLSSRIRNKYSQTLHRFHEYYCFDIATLHHVFFPVYISQSSLVLTHSRTLSWMVTNATNGQDLLNEQLSASVSTNNHSIYPPIHITLRFNWICTLSAVYIIFRRRSRLQWRLKRRFSSLPPGGPVRNCWEWLLNNGRMTILGRLYVWI
jgi:hypothetical protein